MARIALAGVIGRMDTTRGPWNGPAGAVAMEVRYIGTVTPQVMWRSSIPSSISASSKENEQPSDKRDEIVAPMAPDIVRLVDEFAARNTR